MNSKFRLFSLASAAAASLLLVLSPTVTAQVSYQLQANTTSPAVKPTSSETGKEQNPAPAETQILSFDDAVKSALGGSYATLSAEERINEARGKAYEAKTSFLPQVGGIVSEKTQTLNLAAMGFASGVFPGSLPLLLGPFNTFDARAKLVQSIFDWKAIQQYKAGQAGVALAQIDEQLARQQVITRTAIAYLNSISAEKAVDAERANMELAASLLKLAQDRREAGFATGIDVTRAEIRLAESRLRLSQSETTSHQAQMDLLRAAALPLSRSVKLIDTLRFSPEPLPPAAELITEAQRDRLEIKMAEEQVRITGYQLSASKAERLPKVEFVGDYGESGNTPWTKSIPTRTAGVNVTIPIFGGRADAHISQSRSQQQQALLKLQDVRAQVEEDIRLSLQHLITADEQVRVARQALTLSQRELEMARDRFTAGVADNLEVINAQTNLTIAREREVAALAQYNAARINVAAARGKVESFHWQ